MIFHHLFNEIIACDRPLGALVESSKTKAAVCVKKSTQPLAKDQLDSDWFSMFPGPEGDVLSWRDVGRIYVAKDGKEILYDLMPTTSWETFQIYLLSHALTTALVRQGREYLHGTGCEIDGKGLVVLGYGGDGKSTLLAELLSQGAKFLSDDVICISRANEVPTVRKSVSRIKLYPDSLRASKIPLTTSALINTVTEKKVFQFSSSLISELDSVPIDRIVCLETQPTTEIILREVFGAEKFKAICENTFNTLDSNTNRRVTNLQRLGPLAKNVRVFRFLYPRNYEVLPEVGRTLMASVGK